MPLRNRERPSPRRNRLLCENASSLSSPSVYSRSVGADDEQAPPVIRHRGGGSLRTCLGFAPCESARKYSPRIDAHLDEHRLGLIPQADRARGTHARLERGVLPDRARPVARDVHAIVVVEVREDAEDKQMLPQVEAVVLPRALRDHRVDIRRDVVRREALRQDSLLVC